MRTAEEREFGFETQYKEMFNKSIALQQKYATLLKQENIDGNIHTAEVYLQFICDLQKVIDRNY
jgi:hypothetical protein